MTQDQRTQAALSLYDAMTPEMRAQFLEVLRCLKKAQDAGKDAQMREAMTAAIRTGKAGNGRA